MMAAMSSADVHDESAAIEHAHRLRTMSGRDPDESHRASTPLELLFDLTFVVAFSFAGNEVAHAFAEAHWSVGLMGFAFVMFGIVWAWINYSWFASAFDTDDWLFRITTFVQMVGVVIFAIGIPPVFESLTEGHVLDNRLLVAGYVVMRLAMLAQWLRAALQCTGPLRRTCLIYVTTLGVAQVGWLIQILVNFSIPVTAVLMAALILLEVAGPVLGERNFPTPWHAEHIAERYSLLTIIALGEGIVGAAVSLSAAVDATGWTWESALVAIAGVGLTFGMWWVYFVLPSAEALEANRAKSFGWGYGHYLVFGAVAAVGAGLHVSAYYLEHEAHISAMAAVATVAVPVGIYLVAIFALYAYLIGRIDGFTMALLAGALAVLVVGVLAAQAHLSLAVCLVIVALSPAVVVAGYELRGYRTRTT